MRFEVVPLFINSHRNEGTILIADVNLRGKFNPGESAYLRARAHKKGRRLPSHSDPIIRVVNAALAPNLRKTTEIEVFRYETSPPERVTIRLAFPNHPKSAEDIARRAFGWTNLLLARRAENIEIATGEIPD